MEMVEPPPSRGNARHSWASSKMLGNAENPPLESIHEGARLDSSGPGAQKKTVRKMASKQSLAWPFHRRNASEAPSSVLTSNFRPSSSGGWNSHFRRPSSGWNNLKSFFNPKPEADADDAASMTSRPLVPDYVVHYLRGETPESLARKRDAQQWGQRGVTMVTPQEERHMSCQIELEDPWASLTQLNIDGVPFANEQQQQGLARYQVGWKGGAAVNSLLTFLLLLVAVVCLIVVITRNVVEGEALLFAGSCDQANAINTGLHALISLFTVVLLASSNYIFQVLSSPTRIEVARAHNKKQWLDIGIPSIRNLPHIAGLRTALAVLALLTAVATQIIYNGIIFTSSTGFNTDVVFVTDSFVDRAPFSNASETNVGGLSRIEILALQDDASAGKLANLTVDECRREFGGLFDATYDAVLLVTEIKSASSVVQTGTLRSRFDYYSGMDTATTAALDSPVVQYCLARAGPPQTCRLEVSSYLLGTVAVLNLVVLTVIVSALVWKRFMPLVTLGDAIRSFMRNPDPTTATTCFLDKKDVEQGRWGFNEAKYFEPKDHYWLFTPSALRWGFTAACWLALAAPTAAALGLVTARDRTGGLSPLGTPTPYSTFALPLDATPSAVAVIAALPQLLLAALYLAVNSLLTAYWLSHESSLFAVEHHALRVSSDAVGEQSTSLFLTLPRPVSWVLLTWFAAMGFLLSQAVFPAVFEMLSPVAPSSFHAVGFSTQALLALLALLVVLALGVLALGLRRAPPAVYHARQRVGNPLALRGGACSAALAAKCHSAPGEVDKPWRRPVAYGVVNEALGMSIGHCAFSALGIGNVDPSKPYG